MFGVEALTQNLLPGTESISEDPFGKGSTRLEGGFSRVLQVQTFLEGRQGGTEKRRAGFVHGFQCAN